MLAGSKKAVPTFYTSKVKGVVTVVCAFFGSLRPADVLPRLYEVLCEFFVNILREYGGTRSFKLLDAIILDLMSISSLIVFQPSFSIN